MIDPMKLADEIHNEATSQNGVWCTSIERTWPEWKMIVTSLRTMAQPDTHPAKLADEPVAGPHPSHKLRSSDASTYDVICERCHRTDQTPDGWGRLIEPCPVEPASGDVRERIAMHLAGNVSAKQMAANPKEARRARRAADEVLELLHPGDRIGGCVLVPVVPTEAARDVLAERRRQVEAEGWTPAHDDAHAAGVIALAGACYARFGGEDSQMRQYATDRNIVPLSWPWAKNWWKPTTRRRDLVKAGALILAEIERLDRIAAIPEAPDAD